ncbi:MAG: sulfurtransferase [Candidatus Hodarchaeales archaeon]|jgi:thiosulfate/3-mercaptopyruvate sulfurtransferase
MYSTFITTEQLYEIYQDENVAIVDIRSPDDNQILRNHKYLDNHIPNAFYADFNNEITGDENIGKGRNPLPNISDFKNWLERNNLHPNNLDLQIIIYDDSKGSNAARVWWQLRTLKFHSVAVLEGGFSQWVRKNYPLVTGEEKREISDEPVLIPRQWEDGLFPFVELDVVKNNIETRDNLLIDSRDADRFNAITSGVDPIDGHIPGSKHFHWAYNTDDQGLLKSKDILKRQLEQVINPEKFEKIIFSCGSGVTACYNILVSEYLGLGIPRLYVGSWSEWSTHYPDFKEP